METNVITINKFFKLKRLALIFAYVVIKYNTTKNPVLPNEIAQYYNISHKQVLGYIKKLDDSGYTKRPKDTCPRPISPTEEGRKMYNDKISAFFSRREQRSIKRHSILE